MMLLEGTTGHHIARVRIAYERTSQSRAYVGMSRSQTKVRNPAMRGSNLPVMRSVDGEL